MKLKELYESLTKFKNQPDFDKSEVFVYYVNPITKEADYLELGGIGFVDDEKIDAIVLVDLEAVLNTKDKHIKFPDEQ